MSKCGVELFGFDQLVPGDGRLEALTWSWAAGVPDSGDCAVSRGSDGRWETASCRTPRRQACRTADGRWLVARDCGKAGATFAAPRTARENQLLREVAGTRTVRLGLSGASTNWKPLDPR